MGAEIGLFLAGGSWPTSFGTTALESSLVYFVPSLKNCSLQSAKASLSTVTHNIYLARASISILSGYTIIATSNS